MATLTYVTTFNSGLFIPPSAASFIHLKERSQDETFMKWSLLKTLLKLMKVPYEKNFWMS